MLTAYCVGLCLALAARPPWWIPALALAAITAGLWFALRRGGTAGSSLSWLLAVPACLAVFFLVAGLAMGGHRLKALERSSLTAYVGQSVALTAVLTDLPAIKEDQVTLAVDLEEVGHAPLREAAHLRLRLDDGQRFALDPCGALVEGARIQLASVRVEPLPEAKPGAFDYGRYLRRRGEHALLEGLFADLRVTGRRDGLQGAIDRLRLASRAHLRAGVRPPLSDVLQGMVLGDDEGVDQQLVDDFRRSGLLHILAVSGENVVLLCGMWSFAFTLLAVPRLARTALLIPVVATYVLLTGASPSIVRAGVAGVVGLLAILASRPSDGWLVWLAPGAWLLTVNPNNLFDVSFQLSFGAVLGLLVLARPLIRALAFLPGPLPEQVGITTAASLSTAPVSMLTFGSVSVVGVLATVAGTPTTDTEPNVSMETGAVDRLAAVVMPTCSGRGPGRKASARISGRASTRSPSTAPNESWKLTSNRLLGLTVRSQAPGASQTSQPSLGREARIASSPTTPATPAPRHPSCAPVSST